MRCRLCSECRPLERGSRLVPAPRSEAGLLPETGDGSIDPEAGSEGPEVVVLENEQEPELTVEPRGVQVVHFRRKPRKELRQRGTLQTIGAVEMN